MNNFQRNNYSLNKEEKIIKKIKDSLFKLLYFLMKI